jgi:hypothetical protein
MKKTIFNIFLTLFALMGYPQDTTYYSVLRGGIDLANEGYVSENFRELANICERISASESKEWLPFYYGAYAYINMSFIEKNNDKKNILCEKAKTLLDKAKILKPGESELDVLETLLCYALMEINPMVNGIVYLPKANKALDEAKSKNPDNPRIYYLKGKSTMFMPEFMGGGKKATLPILQKALEMFNDFVPETDVHPNWGKQDAVKLLEECKNENK